MVSTRRAHEKSQNIYVSILVYNTLGMQVRVLIGTPFHVSCSSSKYGADKTHSGHVTILSKAKLSMIIENG